MRKAFAPLRDRGRAQLSPPRRDTKGESEEGPTSGTAASASVGIKQNSTLRSDPFPPVALAGYFIHEISPQFSPLVSQYYFLAAWKSV